MLPQQFSIHPVVLDYICLLYIQAGFLFFFYVNVDNLWLAVLGFMGIKFLPRIKSIYGTTSFFIAIISGGIRNQIYHSALHHSVPLVRIVYYVQAVYAVFKMKLEHVCRPCWQSLLFLLHLLVCHWPNTSGEEIDIKISEVHPSVMYSNIGDMLQRI